MNKFIPCYTALFVVAFSGYAANKPVSLTLKDSPVDEIIKELTLEEKALLSSGASNWKTQAIERLGIPSVFMTDGPHGVRINEGFDLTQPSVPATCFPTASLLASSWDKELAYEMGQAIGDESNHYGVNMLLGPGVNIKRSPLGGRNFEYFSEDPLVSGEMAAAFINGVQSKGVGTSLKHFSANNQEFERMSISAEVDERTMREIYLPAFEIAITKSQPTSIMAAYNKVNGQYCTENSWLLTDILRDEFGYFCHTPYPLFLRRLVFSISQYFASASEIILLLLI